MMIFFIVIPPLNFTVITVYHISKRLSIYGINFSLFYVFLLISHNEWQLALEKCFFSSTKSSKYNGTKNLRGFSAEIF